MYRCRTSAAVVSSTSTGPCRAAASSRSRTAVSAGSTATCRSSCAISGGSAARHSTAPALPAPQPGRTTVPPPRPSPRSRRCPPAAPHRGRRCSTPRPPARRPAPRRGGDSTRRGSRRCRASGKRSPGSASTSSRRTSQAGTPSSSPSSTSNGHRNRSAPSSQALSPSEKRCRWLSDQPNTACSTPCSSSTPQRRRQHQAAPHRWLGADQVDPYRKGEGPDRSRASPSDRLRPPPLRTDAGEVQQLPGRGPQLVEVHRGNRGSNLRRQVRGGRRWPTGHAFTVVAPSRRAGGGHTRRVGWQRPSASSPAVAPKTPPAFSRTRWLLAEPPCVNRPTLPEMVGLRVACPVAGDAE